mgnify:CR=1 FL=1
MSVEDALIRYYGGRPQYSGGKLYKIGDRIVQYSGGQLYRIGDDKIKSKKKKTKKKERK